MPRASARAGRTVRALGVLHRRALALLPDAFAAVHADSMAECFAAGYGDVRAERGWWSALIWALRDVVDVVRTARGLRKRARTSKRRSRPRREIMGTMWNDVRHGVRLWTRTPGFTSLAVSTLAIGIAAATTMFTVVDHVLLRPLPHRDGDRLVMVSQTLESFGASRVPVSYPNFLDFRAAGAATGLEDMAAYMGQRGATVVLNDEPESLDVVPIGGNLLTLLGDAPALGRGIAQEDDDPRAAHVVLLSHALWQNRFGGDTGVLARSVRVDGVAHRVIGVMPSDFAFPSAGVDLWVPLRLDAAVTERDTRFLRVIGRLAPGRTLESAQAGIAAVNQRLVEAWPDANAGTGTRVDLRKDVVVGDVRAVLYVLLGAVTLLLVLGCVNIANLMLARAATRQREVAVRAALGAPRRRIVAQLMTENAILATAGGTLGVLLAWVGIDLLSTLAPATLPRRTEIVLDGRIVAFTAGVTILCALLFGVLPSLRTARRDPGHALRDGRAATGSGRHRLLRSLVVAQLAMAFVLLAGSGLLLNSFVRLISVDPGFEADHVLTMRLAPTGDHYQQWEALDAFYDVLLERIRVQPGVESVGATWALPFGGDWASGRITVEGRPLPEGEEPVVGTLPVRGDFFAALRVPILAGRAFDETDDDANVAILNQTAARSLFPQSDAIGKRFKRGRADEDLPWITVVGIVPDIKRFGLEDDAQPEAYRPHGTARWARDLHIVTRIRNDPLTLVRPIRSIVRDLDPELAIRQVATLRDLVGDSVEGPRFRTMLLTAFAAFAFLLAVLGVYAVLAFVTTGRTREIGLRMALGANRGRVLAGILREGATLIAGGLGLGLLAAAIATRSLESMLFQLGTLDPLTYLTTTATLALAAILACWIPARRASRTNPQTALRDG